MKKVLAFSGSNHSQSINQTLVTLAAEKFTSHEVTIIDLNEYEMPLYGLDVQEQGFPDSAIQLRELMSDYDALVIASPEHNGSMPAFLKNVIDWLSRLTTPGKPFFGDKIKPVLLMSTSPGATGGATNLKHMAELMPWWGGDVKDTYSLGGFYDKYADGKFDPETDQAISNVIKKFEATI
ncbi:MULTISPECIES: NADPH-dependent FMN reductase [Thalassotalea]|uniref:NADPH-dependent FMN reductase n=1 Tax=Thalassotalea TaxID=1518149 RepID=UPI000943D76D|nr:MULTISPECIES: NAD(P)H-dependent oxidoreductase [Thalassotalea]OKY25139.1 NADPH-dependent FMN reductase [Thalassotalea sp. PP2-459]